MVTDQMRDNKKKMSKRYLRCKIDIICQFMVYQEKEIWVYHMSVTFMLISSFLSCTRQPPITWTNKVEGTECRLANRAPIMMRLGGRYEPQTKLVDSVRGLLQLLGWWPALSYSKCRNDLTLALPFAIFSNSQKMKLAQKIRATRRKEKQTPHDTVRALRPSSVRNDHSGYAEQWKHSPASFLELGFFDLQSQEYRPVWWRK